MLRFSANLGFLWPDRPLLDRIDAAARAGFRAIELHWPYDVPAAAVRHACQQYHLRLLGINTRVGDPNAGDFGLGAIPGREAEFQETVDEAIAYCVESGATMIHAMAGVVPNGFESDAAEVFVENLRTAAAKAEARQLGLLLEPINRRDKPGYFYETVESAAGILVRVDRPNVRILFDCYHIGVSQGDILRRMREFLPLIGHIQIAAVPSRAEPDEGEVSYGALLRAIETLPYSGWTGCEYRPRGDTDAGLAWMKMLGFPLGRQ